MSRDQCPRCHKLRTQESEHEFVLDRNICKACLKVYRANSKPRDPSRVISVPNTPVPEAIPLLAPHKEHRYSNGPTTTVRIRYHIWK
jgi:hypothetical protein